MLLQELVGYWFVYLAVSPLKLLFPSLEPIHEDFVNYCVKPAVELRQRVRDELHKMDPEYPQVAIGVPT
jgi:ATP-dependent Lon protease